MSTSDRPAMDATFRALLRDARAPRLVQCGLSWLGKAMPHSCGSLMRRVGVTAEQDPDPTHIPVQRVRWMPGRALGAAFETPPPAASSHAATRDPQPGEPTDPPEEPGGESSGAGDFDPAFYRRRYGDLVILVDDAALEQHYNEHGRREGRFPNAHTMIGTLEAQYGALPRDFIPEHYRVIHADLASKTVPWELEEHYLCFGRPEGRRFKAELTAFEQDYARLRVEGVPGADGRLGAAHAESFAKLVAAARLLPGPWLDRFVLHEFALMNAAWLPRSPASRMEGLYLFLTMGIERLAPIALRVRFDPDFHRANAPDGHAGIGDADLYRRWLCDGLSWGEPGTEAAALTVLLGEDRFPDGFDEAAYRSRLPEAVPPPGPGRFAALRHFVTTGFTIPEVEIVRQACSAQLLEQIAEHHLCRGDAVTAEAAYARAIVIAPGIGRLHHRRGDALRMLGRGDEATRAFVIAAEAPGAIVWSQIHALDGLLEQPGGVPAACERVRRSAQAWQGSPHWRAAAQRVIARAFDLASAQARDLYAKGRRREADERLTACLDQVAALIRTADPLPAALPAPQNGRIVIVANRDLPQCDHYRVAQRVRQLEQGGWTVEVFGQGEAERSRPAIDEAAAVIFYRVAAFPKVLHAILYARALGLPTIYEIDDLIFDPEFYPDPLESFEGQISSANYVELQYGVPLFRYAMRACETGLASTPALADAMRPLVSSGVCHVLRNGLDERNRPFLIQPHVPFSETALTIFYGSGTRAHNRDFTDRAAPALLDALARHPQVRLVIAGYLKLDDRFAPFAPRVLQLGFEADVSAYWEVLSGADINLAVLAPGTFADAKSEIKWLEAAMCGIPSIVSATRTYREFLTDGEDVLLVETARDWSRALHRLIAEPALRRRIGGLARTKALSIHGLDAAVEVLGGVLPPPVARPHAGSTVSDWATGALCADAVLSPDAGRSDVSPPGVTKAPPGMTRVPRPSRPRVLVVNVFFPPQTVGGATRVVRDNLDHILDHAADRFELAVAATDLDAEAPYRTRVDAYRGVPVHRIASPCEMNMDWRPFNPEMRQPFEALLDRFAPDLVHVHCVQRLTATVVETVTARGIPCVVTVHDAWWISDFQFLVDRDGVMRHPTSDALADATDPALGPIASIARRRRLTRALEGAAAVIAVSETFAELYRRAGFPRAIAIPNGVPRLASVGRRPSPTGRVRLGHIGGRTAHKGAMLVEAILKAGRFGNLALTLVDHALATDHVIEEIWGETPVRIVGKVPQERVADLYADLDVLLAPSLWPESFGLVTREARAAGLWVVAGDRGAIGEEIVDGVDGFRVDVGTRDGLWAALARIDADPERFRASPPLPATPPRMAADQGKDLIALYDSLLRAPYDPPGIAAAPERQTSPSTLA